MSVPPGFPEKVFPLPFFTGFSTLSTKKFDISEGHNSIYKELFTLSTEFYTGLFPFSTTGYQTYPQSFPLAGNEVLFKVKF